MWTDVLQNHPALSKDALRLMKDIRDSVIGNSDSCAIDGPFGARPMVYADYIASGRYVSLACGPCHPTAS